MAAVLDTRIESLKADVLETMGLVRQSLRESVRSLDDRDVDLANEVINREKQVNELEARVDRACLEMLEKKMEGKAFRTVAATFKLIADVERIGDYCVAVANVSLAVANKPVTDTVLSITNMADTTLGMLDTCTKAYREGRPIDIDKVFDADREIDRQYEEAFVGSISSILRDPKEVTNMIYVTVAARALERIGDHITNIAEDIAFIDSGKLARRDEAVYVPEFP
jgi:phosphate transport system protein